MQKREACSFHKSSMWIFRLVVFVRAGYLQKDKLRLNVWEIISFPRYYVIISLTNQKRNFSNSIHHTLMHIQKISGNFLIVPFYSGFILLLKIQKWFYIGTHDMSLWQYLPISSQASSETGKHFPVAASTNRHLDKFNIF